MLSPLTEQLIHALRCLPGVGPRTAERMAFHLITRARADGERLSDTLKKAVAHIQRCTQCRIPTEETVCRLCQNPKRNREKLCIVETVADARAIEKTAHYTGLYFVLMGHLSPLDGIGPTDIGMHLLAERLKAPELNEIILATNSTVEGEATAYYITQLAKPMPLQITRIAHGVPAGGELEYLDPMTLSYALKARAPLENNEESMT